MLGNFTALAILVAGLVTESTSDLTGGELLLTGFAIWTADLIVFGLLFWELESGGPVARTCTPPERRPTSSFRRTRIPSPHRRAGARRPGTTSTSR